MISGNILFAIESQIYGITCLKILLVVTAPSVNSFKNRLDIKFWSTQELKYNWPVEITGD